MSEAAEELALGRPFILEGDSAKLRQGALGEDRRYVTRLRHVQRVVVMSSSQTLARPQDGITPADASHNDNGPPKREVKPIAERG